MEKTKQESAVWVEWKIKVIIWDETIVREWWNIYFTDLHGNNTLESETNPINCSVLSYKGENDEREIVNTLRMLKNGKDKYGCGLLMEWLYDLNGICKDCIYAWRLK